MAAEQPNSATTARGTSALTGAASHKTSSPMATLARSTLTLLWCTYWSGQKQHCHCTVHHHIGHVTSGTGTKCPSRTRRSGAPLPYTKLQEIKSDQGLLMTGPGATVTKDRLTPTGKKRAMTNGGAQPRSTTAARAAASPCQYPVLADAEKLAQATQSPPKRQPTCAATAWRHSHNACRSSHETVTEAAEPRYLQTAKPPNQQTRNKP